MDEYYKILDNAEEKRHHDQAKIQFSEIKERGGEAWIAFVAKHELRNGEEINDEKGIAVCEHLMKDASEKKALENARRDRSNIRPRLKD